MWFALGLGIALAGTGEKSSHDLPQGRSRDIEWTSEGRILGAMVTLYKWDADITIHEEVLAPDQVRLTVPSFRGNFTEYGTTHVTLDTVKGRRESSRRLSDALLLSQEDFQIDLHYMEMTHLGGMSLADEAHDAIAGTFQGEVADFGLLLLRPSSLSRLYLGESIVGSRFHPVTPQEAAEHEEAYPGMTWEVVRPILNGAVLENEDIGRLRVQVIVGKPRKAADGRGLWVLTYKTRQQRAENKDGGSFRRIKSKATIEVDLVTGEVARVRIQSSWIYYWDIPLEIHIDDTFVYTIVASTPQPPIQIPGNQTR